MSVDPASILRSSIFRSYIAATPDACKGIASAALSNPNLPFAPDAFIFLANRGKVDCFKKSLREKPFARCRFRHFSSVDVLNECLKRYQNDHEMTQLFMNNFGMNIKHQKDRLEEEQSDEFFDGVKDLTGKRILELLDTTPKRERFISFILGSTGVRIRQPNRVSALSEMVDAFLEMEIGEWESQISAWGEVSAFFDLDYSIGREVESVSEKVLNHALSNGGRFLQALSKIRHPSIQNQMAFKVAESLRQKVLPPPLDWIGALQSKQAYSLFCLWCKENIFWEGYAEEVIARMDDSEKKLAVEELIEKKAKRKILVLGHKAGLPFAKMRIDLLCPLKKSLLSRLKIKWNEIEDKEEIVETILLFRWFLSWCPREENSLFAEEFIKCRKQAIDKIWFSDHFSDIAFFFCLKEWDYPSFKPSVFEKGGFYLKVTLKDWGKWKERSAV